MIWLKSLNLYAVVALIGLGGVIVSGIFIAGERHNQRKHEAAAARINVPLAEMRGRDEAEVAAETRAAKATDDAIAGAVQQQCILTEDTARLLASVR
jgi:hypothetical protein